MARIKSRVRRFFSLLVPLLFISAVHAEQTPVPAKTVTVEAKNEVFAPQHPDQYLSWKATSEQSAREDALAEDPRLVILWAGYPFSRDYNKPRGHAYAVTDVRETLRTGAPKTAEDGPLPMACWSCKSPDVARLIQKDGEDGYFHGKWARGGPEIVNNLGCGDCHNTASPDFAKGKPELTLCVLMLSARWKPSANRLRKPVALTSNPWSAASATWNTTSTVKTKPLSSRGTTA